MDLIPKQKINSFDAGNFIKSRGISISGKEVDFSFLRRKWVVVSLVSVFLALLAWGAIKGYIFYIDKKTSDLASQVDTLISGQSSKSVLGIKDVEAFENTVKILRQGHIYTSIFFDLLERLTFPEVQWQSLTLDAAQGTAQLHGRSVSYSFLAKQIINFEKEKIQISVSGISLDKDGVGFSAKLEFDPALLKK